MYVVYTHTPIISDIICHVLMRLYIITFQTCPAGIAMTSYKRYFNDNRQHYAYGRNLKTIITIMTMIIDWPADCCTYFKVKLITLCFSLAQTSTSACADSGRAVGNISCCGVRCWLDISQRHCRRQRARSVGGVDQMVGVHHVTQSAPGPARARWRWMCLEWGRYDGRPPALVSRRRA